MQSTTVVLSMSVALFVAMSIYSKASDVPSPAEERQIGENTQECLQDGGICVNQDSCSSDNKLNKTGLCPEANGQVCCNGVPETGSCSERGGRCGGAEECENNQQFGQLDCTEGSQCCLLIF